MQQEALRGDVSEGRFFSGSVRVFKERDTHVPTFCPWQEKPEADLQSVRVKQNGVPMLPGFTVADIAPERRWAVLGDGEVMPQDRFHGFYIRQWEEWYTVVKGQRIEGRADRAPIPAAVDFVRFRVDPTNKLNPSLVAIGYEPNRTRGAKAERFATADGEILEKPRLDVLLEQYRKDNTKLRPEEIAEVRAFLAEQDPTGPAAVESAIETLVRQRVRGELTEEDFVLQSAHLLGEKAMLPKKKAALPTPPKARHVTLVTAPCGRELAKQGLLGHARWCKACQQAEAAPALEA